MSAGGRLLCSAPTHSTTPREGPSAASDGTGCGEAGGPGKVKSQAEILNRFSALDAVSISRAFERAGAVVPRK